jgi:hypothetical protein
MMYNHRRAIRYMLLTVLLIASSFHLTNSQVAESQERSLTWSPQERIPGYLERTEPPILVLDPTGIVHAFAHQQVGDPDDHNEIAIIHNTWTYERGWTLPTDIILSPIRQQARVMSAYLDSEGFFHLIFYGGDEQEANLYYSRSHLSRANYSLSWTAPVVIGERPLTPSLAKLAGDGEGNLFVLYSADLDGPGLFLLRSVDSGDTWTGPDRLFLTYDRSYRPLVLEVSWGRSGILHIVWQVVDERGHSADGYYAQFDPQSNTWTKPILIDEGIGVERGMGVANPTVIEYDGRIIVAYNNGIPPEGVPPTNWVRVSVDNGTTWTERIRISREHVGRNGLLSFVVDSDHRLYIFFGLRIPLGGDQATHGMWYSVWQDGQWSNSGAVVSGAGSIGFDPYDARAVIATGNRLLVTWRTDPGRASRGVWYSYAVLDTPTIEPVPVKTPVAVSSDEIVMVDDSAPEDDLPSSSVSTLFFDQEEDVTQLEPSTAIFHGVIPSLMLVLLVLLVNAWRSNKSQWRNTGK